MTEYERGRLDFILRKPWPHMDRSDYCNGYLEAHSEQQTRRDKLKIKLWIVAYAICAIAATIYFDAW